MTDNAEQGSRLLLAHDGKRAGLSRALKLKDLEKSLLAAVGSQTDDLWVYDFPWEAFDREA